MKHLYQYLRLLLWRILDAIDRKLGPGPGDHRLEPTFKDPCAFSLQTQGEAQTE